MDDWDFRVLFRSIVPQGGEYLRKRFAHVAVQIDPEGGRISDPELARSYLEGYFEHADINIFWGSVQDFMKELREQWRAKYGEDVLTLRSEGPS